MRALSVEQLVVEYPRTNSRLRVLDGITLEVRRGELLSLIGPSGCGKTTFLHTLAGLCRPTSGRIDAGGRELGAAMVFQRPTLLPWRSVLDNALFALECRGPIDRAQRAAARAMLESMGLGAHVGDHPHVLSEGMKQRVNLARALLVRPKLLLLDEPFAALDVMTRRQLQDDLRQRCQADGITVVLVSHSLEDVAYLSDRVGVLGHKPTKLVGLRDIDLPHPRARGAEARLALMQIVESLGELLPDVDRLSTAAISVADAPIAST